MAAITSSMNACVDRHATTARGRPANARPMALSRWVLPDPLAPTSTSGLNFFPGLAIASRMAASSFSFDGPAANVASGNAADGPGGGAAPSRTRTATFSASSSRSGSRNTLSPAAWGSSIWTSAARTLSRSTSLTKPEMTWSTAPGVSCASRASRRLVRKPSPSQRRMASLTRARHASTPRPTVAVTSDRQVENSSGAGAGPAAGSAPSPRAAMPSTWRAAASALGASLTAWEPRDEALVQVRELRGRAVGREDDLVSRPLQCLGEPQELRLHLLPVGEELHVVHQQHVHRLEAAAERVTLPRRDRRVERLD